LNTFFSKQVFRLGGSLLGFFLCSCEFDDGSHGKEEFPDFWEGNESDFDRGFSFRKSDGNDSVLHFENSNSPFNGVIERNSSGILTRQTFSDGRLAGKSFKKSKDGSWVEVDYLNGKPHGDMIFYSADGTVRSVIKFENGRLVPNREDLNRSQP
jgi:hypothetical protein